MAAALLPIIKSWGPTVVNLLKRAGYFSLDPATKPEQIAVQIGLSPGSKLFREIVEASKIKNADVWEAVFEDVSLKGILAGCTKASRTLNVPLSAYDINPVAANLNPVAQMYYDRYGDQFIKNMTMTDLDKLHQQIQANFNMNSQVFGETFSESYSCSEARATRIKRTEYHTATQGGGNIFADQAGAKFKQWQCTPRDKWPRPEHRVIWGEIVPMDQPFSNGKMIPDDVNCRCYLLYFWDMPSGQAAIPQYSGGEFTVLGTEKAAEMQAAYEEAIA